ncbi:MAG: cobalt-precorrin-5B (C(1))-methyltransferase CbiD [Atribacterota bacterium]
MVGDRGRLGYTTGSCAAAAAKGSVLLLQGIESQVITITLPHGDLLALPVTWQRREGDIAWTAIRKDGGDDPDVTNGLLIVVSAQKQKEHVTILGGKGVGRVTKPGLPVLPGFPAINPVPERMIRREVQSVLGQGGGVKLVVSIPEGEKVALKTFNPRLGIVGGLSILGTTGIVIPRSVEGFLGTIRAELSVIAHQGVQEVILVFGNYGREYARKKGFSDEFIVSCGNFLGFALEQVVSFGFGRVYLIGELGKMVKVAGGIFLLDSRVADARIEILASFAAFFGVSQKAIARIFAASLTGEVLQVLEEEGVSLMGFGHFVAERVRKRIVEYTEGKIQVVIEVFSLQRGFLGKAEG